MNTLLLLFLFAFPQANTGNQKQEVLIPAEKERYEVEHISLAPADTVKNKKVFNKLYTKALLSMTDSEKSAVRCSAFMTLVKLDHPQVKQIFLKHLEDTESLFLGIVWRQFAEFEQVNQFMLEQLHPVKSTSSYKLTKQEYDRYKKLIYK